MHAERVDTGVVHPREPGVAIRRLALALNGKIDRGFHGGGAVGKDRRAAVGRRRRAGGHHHVGHAVELDRGLRHLGQLLGCLVLDGAAGGERLADGAELAGLGPALIADAGLQHGGGEHVAPVQHGDLPVRNPVGGHAIIKSRARRKAHRAEIEAVSGNAALPERVGLFHHIRALERRRGVHRHHDGDAVDGDRLVVGRAGAAAAALVPDLGINEPNPVGLQLVDQPLGRQRRR